MPRQWMGSAMNDCLLPPPRRRLLWANGISRAIIRRARRPAPRARESANESYRGITKVYLVRRGGFIIWADQPPETRRRGRNSVCKYYTQREFTQYNYGAFMARAEGTLEAAEGYRRRKCCPTRKAHLGVELRKRPHFHC